MNKTSLIVLAVALTVVVHDWGGGVLAPAYLTIVQDFQLTPVELGFLTSVYSLPGIFMSPLYGVLSNRYGRRRILLPLLMLFGVAGIGAGFAADYLMLLVFRALQGFSVAACYPLAIIILGDLFEGDKRGHAVGNLYSVLRVVGIVIPLTGGFLTLISWRWTLFSSIVAFPIALFAFKVVPETKPTDALSPTLPGASEDIRHEKKFSGFAVIGVVLLGLLLFLFFAGGLRLFTPYYVELGLGFSPAETGIILALRMVLVTLVNSQAGKLMARRSKPKILLVAFLLFAGGFIFFSFPPSLLWLLFATILVSCGIGLVFPTLNAYVLDLADPKRRGLITSTYQATAKLGQTIGPTAISYSYTASNEALATPFIMAAGLSFAAATMTVPMIRYTRRTGQGLPEKKSPAAK